MSTARGGAEDEAQWRCDVKSTVIDCCSINIPDDGSVHTAAKALMQTEYLQA